MSSTESSPTAPSAPRITPTRGGIALAVLLWELLMRTATLLGAAVFRWQLRSVRQSRIADTFPR